MLRKTIQVHFFLHGEFIKFSGIKTTSNYLIYFRFFIQANALLFLWVYLSRNILAMNVIIFTYLDKKNTYLTSTTQVPDFERTFTVVIRIWHGCVARLNVTFTFGFSNEFGTVRSVWRWKTAARKGGGRKTTDEFCTNVMARIRTAYPEISFCSRRFTYLAGSGGGRSGDG